MTVSAPRLSTTSRAFDEVQPHWDALLLRSYIREGSTLVPYQEGSVKEFREPLDLVKRFAGADSLPESTLMFCGTLAALLTHLDLPVPPELARLS